MPGLPQAFDGFRIAQLSDIHMDDYTEPFFVRDAVRHINRMNPDAVFLTGDFVTYGFCREDFPSARRGNAPICSIELECPHRYAVLGNHDVLVSRQDVIEALTENGITVLDNANAPIERAGARFWLAGLDDPVEGKPDPELAIPASIRNVPREPIVLLCHAPDYVDDLSTLAVGQAFLSCSPATRTAARFASPLLGPMILPQLGTNMSRDCSALATCNSMSIADSDRSACPSGSTAHQRLRFSRYARGLNRCRLHPRCPHVTSPAIVIPSMRIVGDATDPRKTKSLPIAVTLRSISARLPAIVTSSTACVSWPFSIQSPSRRGSSRR